MLAAAALHPRGPWEVGTEELSREIQGRWGPGTDSDECGSTPTPTSQPQRPPPIVCPDLGGVTPRFEAGEGEMEASERRAPASPLPGA